jgi:hypothetical protein
MSTRAKVLIAAVALLSVVGTAAMAQDLRFGAIVSGSAKLLDKAATSGKSVSDLWVGQPLQVLSRSAKTEKVGGIDSYWYECVTIEKKKGWVHGSVLRVPTYPLGPDQLDYESYGTYVSLLLRKGERVAAAYDSYDWNIRAGDMGWYFGGLEEGYAIVIWDHDIGNYFYRNDLPKDFPADLCDRTSFVDPSELRIVGNAKLVDFTELASEWIRAQPIEQAFPEGSVVSLRKYVKAQDQNPASEGWDKSLDKFAGKEGTVLYFNGYDDWGEPVFQLDVGGTEVQWRAYSMRCIEKAEYYVYDYGYGGDEYYEEYYEDVPMPEFDTTGNVRVGDSVVLYRQEEVNGDDGWDNGMNTYVGKKAKVKEIVGPDDYGFTCIKIDLDKGKYLWRIRDLEVVGKGEKGSYGFAIGDTVILGRHRIIQDYDLWVPEMNAYVGQVATITDVYGIWDEDKCYYVYVDADNGNYAWRAENLEVYEGGY